MIVCDKQRQVRPTSIGANSLCIKKLQSMVIAKASKAAWEKTKTDSKKEGEAEMANLKG